MPNRSLAAAAPSVAASIGRYRWVICALLFFATTINYVDRQVIGILKTTLQKEFGWSEIDYADIIFAFQLAYAIAFLFAGRMIDWLGTKKGYIVALVVWSLAAMAHAEAPVFGPTVASILALVGLTYTASVAGFIFARLALGFGEAGNFPAAIKVTAEWFPKKERALATGLFNSGTNVGAVLTPLVVPSITLHWGWYWAFVITGALGFLWLVLLDSALPLAGEPPARRRGRAGAHPSDPPDPPAQIPWLQLLQVPPDLGFRARQVSHRPGVVALSLLDSRFPREELRHRSQDDRPAAHRDLSHRRCRLDRWRLAVVGAAQARLERERRSQDGDAGVRAGGVADGVRVEGHGPVVSRRARRAWQRPPIRVGPRTSSP